MYHIVTGVTSDVDVPSTYLVIRAVILVYIISIIIQCSDQKLILN